MKKILMLLVTAYSMNANAGFVVVHFGNEGQTSGTVKNVQRQTQVPVRCDVANFGDPAPGVPKKCKVGNTLVDEGKFFNVTVNGSIDVTFGAPADIAKPFPELAPIQCSVASFGKDPQLGVKKKCWWTDNSGKHVVNEGENFVINDRPCNKYNVFFGTAPNFDHYEACEGTVVKCGWKVYPFSQHDPFPGSNKTCLYGATGSNWQSGQPLATENASGRLPIASSCRCGGDHFDKARAIIK